MNNTERTLNSGENYRREISSVPCSSSGVRFGARKPFNCKTATANDHMLKHAEAHSTRPTHKQVTFYQPEQKAIPTPCSRRSVFWSHLGDIERDHVPQHFLVEALLTHIAGQAAGPPESIPQSFQLHVSDWKRNKKAIRQKPARGHVKRRRLRFVSVHITSSRKQ